MNMEPVISSNIVAIGFENGTLHVEFRNGTYEYTGVSKETFQAFKEASSPGRFFIANIKNQYPSTKIL